MTNLSLQDRFSLISLNALNSTRNSTAKKQQFAVSLLPVYWIDFYRKQKSSPKTLTNTAPDWMLYLFL